MAGIITWIWLLKFIQPCIHATMHSCTHIIIFVATLLFFSCDITFNETTYKPKSKGKTGEIIIIMDSSRWKGSIGEELRKTFLARQPGLPQDESMFDIKYIYTGNFTGFFKTHRNIVIVTSFEDKSADGEKLKSLFTKELLNKINNNEELFMLSKKDIYAQDQKVVHLFSKTDKELVRKIKANSKKLQRIFHDVERIRTIKKIFRSNERKELGKKLAKQHKFQIRIPYRYKLAKNRDNFVWLRYPKQAVDRNIFITWKPYTTEEAFKPELIVVWRDSVCKTHIYGSDDSGSFMLTESLVPVHTEKVNFKKKYALESRGLWKLNNLSMGGPFISYTFVDKKSNRIYYIEGFVYAPAFDKREYVRELEAVLWTFRISRPR